MTGSSSAAAGLLQRGKHGVKTEKAISSHGNRYTAPLADFADECASFHAPLTYDPIEIWVDGFCRHFGFDSFVSSVAQDVFRSFSAREIKTAYRIGWNTAYRLIETIRCFAMVYMDSDPYAEWILCYYEDISRPAPNTGLAGCCFGAVFSCFGCGARRR